MGSSLNFPKFSLDKLTSTQLKDYLALLVSKKNEEINFENRAEEDQDDGWNDIEWETNECWISNTFSSHVLGYDAGSCFFCPSKYVNLQGLNLKCDEYLDHLNTFIDAITQKIIEKDAAEKYIRLIV